MSLSNFLGGFMSLVLALSDTHMTGNKLAPNVQYYAGRADYIFHAGDFTTKVAYDGIKAACKGELITVIGNTDIAASDLDLLKALKKNARGSTDPTGETAFRVVDGIKIGLMHDACKTDQDFVEETATNEANRMGADVLIFGHIHQPVIAWGRGNKLLVCPGRSGSGDAKVKKCSLGTVAVLNTGNGKIDAARIIRTWQ
jgi:putative phosphoesterase